MEAVTIDKFDIKIHERYAKDQLLLDPTYLKEASLIPPHSEVTGTSAIYASKWEELFEIQIRNLPWATFSPPPLYHIHAKRLFSYRLIPSLDLRDQEEDDAEQESQDEEQEEGQKSFANKEIVEKILGASSQKITPHVEKERSTLLSLVESIRHLDKMLKHVNARKLQYQKG